MPDPVTRAAKRQNLLDRIAEQLTDWGCPPDAAVTRAAALLHFAEEGGWQLPTSAVPPLAGRGSTPEGRALARAILDATRAGCRCGMTDARLRALPAAEHPRGCPVRDAYDQGGTAAPEGAARYPSGPLDKIDSPPRVDVPAGGLRHSDETRESAP